MEKLHDTAMECHLQYGITQCYLHPTQVNTPRLHPARQAGTRFIDHVRVEGLGCCPLTCCFCQPFVYVYKIGIMPNVTF